MKTLIRFLASGVLAVISLLPIHAQSPVPEASSKYEAERTIEKAFQDRYGQFLDKQRTDPLAAYRIARESLQAYPRDNEQTKYMRDWILGCKWHVAELMAEEKFEEGFALGRGILASEPDDFYTLVHLVNGALNSKPHPKTSYFAEGIRYARKALKIAESGQVVLEDKEQIIGELNQALGILLLESAPAEAAVFFYKALESKNLKDAPPLHAHLAYAIFEGRYRVRERQFNARFLTPEQKMSAQAGQVQAEMEQALELFVRLLARAVALADSNPKFAALKAHWMKNLTDVYTARNGPDETGLPELIESMRNAKVPR